MQTILGAGGAVGVELAKALPDHTDQIRLVSRSPKKVNDTDQVIKADLMDPVQVNDAVEGSDIVYLTVGLPYNLKVWQSAWPQIMKSVITACKDHGSKLVFFDNIYMYDENHLNPMDENAPVNPPSKKGRIRAEIAQMLMDEVKAGSMQALIARSADFYGPSVKNTSILTETVFKPLSAGKKANWLGSVNYKHSFTYVPDAGKATALLGNTPDAYNQVWHLPTAADPPTGKEWIEYIAKELKVEPRFQAAPKFLVRIMGFFMPVMKELVEMMYQYDRDYIFDSSKFEKKFNINPTSYYNGIEIIVAEDYIGNNSKI